MFKKFSNYLTLFFASKTRKILSLLALIIIAFYGLSYPLARQLKDTANNSLSPTVLDRNGKEIIIKPNAKGYYQRPLQNVPLRVKQLLLQKEDRFFYWHLGINPFSIVRDRAQYMLSSQSQGSSTLTQQLVKNLLGNEKRRTITNKFIEAVYALAFEAHSTKDDILSMYLSTAYFGNSMQGLTQASQFYFQALPESLNDNQILSLLSTLNNPSQSYPGTFANQKRYKRLARLFHIPIQPVQISKALTASQTAFELSGMDMPCANPCRTTIDADITQTVRDIVERNLQGSYFAGVKNAAIVVIKLPEDELLAVIGSPNPNSLNNGYRINMATKPRPIGSTAKPFIYLNAFQKGARPYTLVDDREYKYTIGTGFAFYPKNYDGQFRGTVTLHQALSNSLNVPSVKVLEYTGLETIYQFFQDMLGFHPLRPLESYQLGIALGGLEIDLLTLCHYFTLFPLEGVLKPLYITNQGGILKPAMQEDMPNQKQVGKKEFVQLVNKILSDRQTSVDQFGMASNLNLPQSNYALKTGTSRDFHDSWTIGYTPDFLVGVWLGNADNTPMWQLSGQSGAGKIWHEVMDVMLNSPYNKKTPFDFSQVKEFTQSGSIEYGLAYDDYQTARTIMQDTHLISAPHQGDTFLFQDGMTIPLTAQQDVSWYINDSPIGKGKNLSWRPTNFGEYRINAKSATSDRQTITIVIQKDEGL